MNVRIVTFGAVVALFGLLLPVIAAIYVIDNPSDKIKNPASTMNNPATQIKNPASNIYNPADRMENPDPLSPVTPAIPRPPEAKNIPAVPAVKTGKRPLIRATVAVPHKEYHFKTVAAYIFAAKKAFSRDNYSEFLAITDDALRRIAAGTLKASNKSRQTLLKYKIFGQSLLDRTGE
ncbi:MAG TPA: hypothetical protein HPP97_03730 [Desulfuromonadales bacterium]|nr:hypothetical protein [Desulfuromonadales bacterium]